MLSLPNDFVFGRAGPTKSVPTLTLTSAHIFATRAVTKITRRASSRRMRNFLIDTDTACDDAVAIMMALPGSSLPGVREIACAQGFATSVTQAGVSTLKIRQQTGHA